MKRKMHVVAAAALAVGLAACSEEQAEAPKAPPPAASAPAPAEAPAPKPAPAAETKAASAGDTRAVLEKACLAAVEKETSESNVSVDGYEFSEANSVVMIAVGAQRAPWRCLVSNDGVVQEVMFTGNDGGGVPEPSDASVGEAPADASAADQGCPADVSEADRYKYPACN